MKYALAAALLILPIFWLILQVVMLCAKAATQVSRQDDTGDKPADTPYDPY